MSASTSIDTTAAFGLYLHVPYCAALCPYCDFAKTANFTAALQQHYLEQLEAHVAAWLDYAPAQGFSSVFFGGGTPSLFAAEYAPLFARLRPRLAAGCEVSLEANPDDISPERLKIWRDLGINRLSLGVQTFDAGGLAGLKRLHSAKAAVAAIEAALHVFPHLNIDLIYGWPGQTMAIWQRDLACALALGVRHLSLYSLTYESRTPLGRLELRGRVTRATDDTLADMYAAACAQLAGAGFIHDEVSNWAKPGASCKHNWLYWQDQSFIGVGAGAHGYLAADGIGVRYAYDRSDRAFNQRALGLAAQETLLGEQLAERFGVVVDAQRGDEEWLTEVVGSGLRTRLGIALAAMLRRSGRVFNPTPVLQEGLDQGLLGYVAGILTLRPDEWFREAAWAVEVLRSCAESSFR